MKFTDEDLKRLKYEFEPYVLGDPRILTGSDWESLIARLEAAEQAVEIARKIQIGPMSWKYFAIAWQNWRAVSGR